MQFVQLIAVHGHYTCPLCKSVLEDCCSGEMFQKGNEMKKIIVSPIVKDAMQIFSLERIYNPYINWADDPDPSDFDHLYEEDLINDAKKLLEDEHPLFDPEDRRRLEEFIKKWGTEDPPEEFT